MKWCLARKRPRLAVLMLTAWPSTVKTDAGFYLPWNLRVREAKTNTNSRWKHLDFPLLAVYFLDGFWTEQLLCSCYSSPMPINTTNTRTTYNFLLNLIILINLMELICYCRAVHLNVHSYRVQISAVQSTKINTCLNLSHLTHYVIYNVVNTTKKN